MKKILTTLFCLMAGLYLQARTHACTITADTFVALYGVGQSKAEMLLSKCFIFQWTDTVNGAKKSSFRRNYNPKRIENNNDMFNYDIFDIYTDSVAFSTTNKKTFSKYKKSLLSYGFKLKTKSHVLAVYVRNEYSIFVNKETHDRFNVYKIVLRK